MNDTVTPLPDAPKRGPGRPPKATEPVAAAVPEPKWDEKLHPVKLLKHYRPRSMNFRIDVAVPPPVPGVASDFKDKNGVVVGRKLWAGTVVALPRDEAMALLTNEAISYEQVRDENGKPIRDPYQDKIKTREVRTRFPLAERADPLPD